MKANELRVGNYICLLEDQPETVEQVTKISQDLTDNEFINPIPLTEEWLKKLGFELMDTEPWHEWACEALTISDVLKSGELFTWHMTPNQGIMIDYVHELQNLYYTIHKEELVINP